MRAILALCCLCSMLAACGERPVGFTPVMIPVPAGEGSGVPHLAVTHDGTALLSWLEPGQGGHALRYARLGEDGWSPAATVARGEHWFVNWADFPSVVPLSDALWAAHWLVRQPAGGYAYDVMMSLSNDAGATWGEPFSPHSDGTPTEHGFVTLFPWQGGAGVAWLDGRNMAGAGPDTGHEAGHGEAGMTLRAAWVAPDGSRSPEAVVDGLTCDCCQTDVAIGDRGPVLVYRDRTEQEVRDIHAVLAYGDGWQTPVLVAPDGWTIDGCPVNGPAVAASGRTAVVAWFTAAEGRPRVRVARSADAGATFDDPVDVDAEAPLGRVDIALLPDGDAVVSWLRPTGQGATAIAIRRVSADGAPGMARDVVLTTSARAGGFPQMVLASGRLVLAWTEADDRGSRVRSATIDPAQL